MTRRVLLSAQPGERRAAWIEDGRLADLLIQRDDHPGRLGDIYLGRVTAVDRALAAAFVDLGLGQAGFLPLAEAPEARLGEGDRVVARVVRDAAGGKGPRLSARLTRPPPDLAALAAAARPPRRLVRGDDPLNRLLAEDPSPEAILVDDAETCAVLKARAAAARPDLADVVRLDTGTEPLFERPLLEHGGEVEAAIEALLAPRAPLPSGGALWIEPTRALVAIDVDSAGHRATGPEALALAVDLEAAAEIPRQLRLRNLSGLIAIDFLGLAEAAERRRVVAALRAAAKEDPAPGRVYAMSPRGLVEMTRRRGGPALHEILTAPCGEEGSGRVKTGATLAFEALRAARRSAARQPGARLVLRASPAVVAALDGPAASARAAFEDRLGGRLAVETAPAGMAGGYEVLAGR